MKLSELSRGTKILIPCARCGYKRSLIFHGAANYQKQKAAVCNQCKVEDQDFTGSFTDTRNHKKAYTPTHEDMN